MKIEQRNPKELKHYKLNAKKHPDSQVAGLAESIKKFGFIQPVVLDGKDEIIIGHGRTMAAIRAGLDTIPTVKLENLSEQEVKALRLIDNRIAESGYDVDLLKMDLGTLDFDLKPFKISFDELLPQEEKEVIEDDGGKEPSDELREKWGVKLGQIWLLGDHRLLCGDSTKAEDVARLMDGKKADTTVTDPPYGVDYVALRGGNKIANDESLDGAERVMQFALSSSPKDTAFVCCNWRSMAVTERAMRSVGMEPKACIVWDKERGVQNLDRYYKRHEFILYAGPYGGQKTVDGDVWAVPRDFDPDHPTPKPVALFVRAMTTCNAQAIYDPFLGSGTTLIAAEQLGRKCYGMEISPDYVAVILQRWADFTGKTPELVDNGEA